MYSKINATNKEDILKQLIDAKKDIKRTDEERIIQQQLLDDRAKRFFEPVVEETKRLDKDIKGIADKVNVKPEFPHSLIDGERLRVDVSRKLLMDIYTYRYLDNKPLKVIEQDFVKRKVDLHNARQKVANNNRIQAKNRTKYNNIMDKIETYLEYVQQYINWRKGYKDLDEKEGEGMDVPVLKMKKTSQAKPKSLFKVIGSPEQVLDELNLNIASIKAGNTSNQLKNDTIQLLDYLYKYKHISPTTYKNFNNILQRI